MKFENGHAQLRKLQNKMVVSLAIWNLAENERIEALYHFLLQPRTLLN